MAQNDPTPAGLEKLTEIGKQYRLALDLGTRREPDTIGGPRRSGVG